MTASAKYAFIKIMINKQIEYDKLYSYLYHINKQFNLINNHSLKLLVLSFEYEYFSTIYPEHPYSYSNYDGVTKYCANYIYGEEADKYRFERTIQFLANMFSKYIYDPVIDYEITELSTMPELFISSVQMFIHTNKVSHLMYYFFGQKRSNKVSKTLLELMDVWKTVNSVSESALLHIKYKIIIKIFYKMLKRNDYGDFEKLDILLSKKDYEEFYMHEFNNLDKKNPSAIWVYKKRLRGLKNI